MVRYALPTPDADTGARFTDVIGTLVESTEAHIVVDADKGRVTVPRPAVLATRIVPPRPSRRGAPHRAISIDDLERVMVGAWPPVQRAPLGDWLLRFAHGFTQRANSALAVGHPDRPVPAALQAVTTWYAARGLTPRLSVPLATGAALADEQVAGTALQTGWTASDVVLVMTSATRSVLSSTEAAARDAGSTPALTIEVTDLISDDWFGLLRGYRSASREAAEAVLHGSPAQRFALARASDRSVVGIARLGISSGWGGLGAMRVDPERRRQGVAQAMLHALAQEAAAHGCVSMHLQVEQSSTSAIAFYDRVGFTTHHHYAYLSAGGG